MFIRNITYVDLDKNTVTRPFHFHLSEAEVVELESEHHGGLTGFAERIQHTENYGDLVKEFKHIVLSAYGYRDGDSFIKTDLDRVRFQGSGAYSALFMEFLQNQASLTEFINGVMPQKPTDTTGIETKSSVIPPPPMPEATIEAGRQILEGGTA